MVFQKGRSGNPGGRPKKLLEDGRSLIDVAKLHTLEAVETLVSVMRDTGAKQSVRLHAASAILDRGWGRPHQSVSADVALAAAGGPMDDNTIAIELSKLFNSLSSEALLIEGEFREVDDGSVSPDLPLV